MTSYAAAIDTPERHRNVTTDYDAARAERDAALQKLRALAPANAAAPDAYLLERRQWILGQMQNLGEGWVP